MGPRIDAPGTAADDSEALGRQLSGQRLGGIQAIGAGLAGADDGDTAAVALHRPLAKEDQRRLGDEGQPAGVIVVPQGDGPDAIKRQPALEGIPIKNISFLSELRKNLGRNPRPAPQVFIPDGVPGLAGRAADVEEGLQAAAAAAPEGLEGRCVHRFLFHLHPPFMAGASYCGN